MKNSLFLLIAVFTVFSVSAKPARVESVAWITERIDARRWCYHHLEHTRMFVEDVTEFGRASGVSAEELELLRVAGWLHDVGYAVDAADHEEVAAGLPHDHVAELEREVSRHRAPHHHLAAHDDQRAVLAEVGDVVGHGREEPAEVGVLAPARCEKHRTAAANLANLVKDARVDPLGAPVEQQGSVYVARNEPIALHAHSAPFPASLSPGLAPR